MHPAGSVDLVLVSLPARLLLGRPQQRTRQRHEQFSATDVLTVSAIVLRPGGYLVAVTNGDGRKDATRDPGSETVALCGEIGLAYWQHIVALLVPIEDGQLQSPSRRPPRDATPGHPLVVHQDVHVFRKPIAAQERRCNELDEARRAA